MKILAVDASTRGASVAIADEHSLIGESFTDYKLKHSEKLLPMIEHLLQDTRLCMKDIDALAVGVGPGSFTGIRIACSTVKGLALGADLPVAGVCSLKAVGLQNSLFAGDVFTIFDAGKTEVYLCHTGSEGGSFVVHRQACLMEDDAFLALLEQSGGGLVAGDGVFRLKERILAAGGRIAPAETLLPRAGSVARLAFREGEFLEGDALCAHYIKNFRVTVKRG